jgi:hypothetical protein
MNPWTRDTFSLLALIVLGALLVLLHVALAMHTVRAPGLPRALRYVSWLPLLAPLAGFMSGAPLLALLWCIVAAAYVVLRTLA